MQGLQAVRSRHLRPFVWGLAAAAVATGAPAYAARYQISGGIQYSENASTVYLDSYAEDVGFTISRQALYDNLGPPRVWHGRADSGADAYGLHASTFTSGDNVADGASGGGGLVAQALVRVTFTDFVIAGPASSGPVQTAINFHLSGQQILGGYTSASPIYTSEVASAVGLIVSAGSNGASGYNNFQYRNGAASPAAQSGLLVGFGGNANVVTPLWTLPVNTPFTLSVQLSTMASVSTVFSDGYVTSALSDFGNTLSFATDRPVFTLPAGYTVNSAEAGVINNAFTTPVPEPASGALLAGGLLAVGVRLRRRRVAVAAAATAATAAASLLPLLVPTSAQAAVQFTVTNLGTLGGASSEGFAINASGQVAGRAYLPSGVAHATRWTDTTALDLGTLGGNYSNAYGINDAGQVAGDSYLANNVSYRAVLWGADGTAQTLGITPNDDASANGVNNSSTVAGTVFPFAAAPARAAQWRNGSLEVLSSVSASQAGGRAINDNGVVVGFFGSYGAVWRPNVAGFQQLASLGSQYSEALAINSAGLIAGYSQANSTANRHAVLWQGTSILDLGTLGGLNGTAYGVNANGEVVGSSQTAAGAYRGFWRLSGALVDLNSMLVAASGATITDARAININGQIAGTALIGGQNRAVRLTPTGSVAWQAGSDGSFADATRWEQGYLPNKFVDASINSAGLQTITVASDGAANNLAVGGVAGAASRPTMRLQGGSILQITGLFTVNETGTLAGDGAVVGNLLNRGTVLPTNITVVGTFTNQGLIAGSGVLNAAVLANGASGQVRTLAGESLQVTGPNTSNAGVIDISGGGQQRYVGTLANAPSGRILLNNGVLRVDNGLAGGLQNAGQVQVSFGGATVYGSVTTSAGGKVILSGASETTFFDAVTVQSGGELRVSNNSTGVFFGLVTQRTGALFTGTGTKFYEGGLSVGASPGLGTDEGSVAFGAASFYTAEIGGITACTAACAVDGGLRDRSFDKLAVAGKISFGGQLKLVSWAGFVGQVGQRFDLFDWGSSSGTFSSVDGSGFTLASGAALDLSQLYATGVVAITAVPEPQAWTLLLAGLGGLVLNARGRRRSS